MKILGIDPGTNILGFAIIDAQKNSIELIDSGILDLRKTKDTFQKLNAIYAKISELLDSYAVDQAAIESPFYGKNVQSMLKLGRAQGVAIAAVMQKQISIYEYAPRKVKIAVTGNGNASKEQVARMLESILGFTLEDRKLDETDAIAIAVCHYFNSKNQQKSQYSSWKDYARKKGLI